MTLTRTMSVDEVCAKLALDGAWLDTGARAMVRVVIAIVNDDDLEMRVLDALPNDVAAFRWRAS